MDQRKDDDRDDQQQRERLQEPRGQGSEVKGQSHQEELADFPLVNIPENPGVRRIPFEVAQGRRNGIEPSDVV